MKEMMEEEMMRMTQHKVMAWDEVQEEKMNLKFLGNLQIHHVDSYSELLAPLRTTGAMGHHAPSFQHNPAKERE